jgi:leucyl-tRNA synthetase
MELVNALYLYIGETPPEKRAQKFLDQAIHTLTLLIAPFAPHLGEEMWESLGNTKSVFLQVWPRYEPKALQKRSLTIILQVNGKVRARIQVPSDISDEDLKKRALAEERIRSYTESGVKRVVVIPGKLVNVVV